MISFLVLTWCLNSLAVFKSWEKSVFVLWIRLSVSLSERPPVMSMRNLPSIIQRNRSDISAVFSVHWSLLFLLLMFQSQYNLLDIWWVSHSPFNYKENITFKYSVSFVIIILLIIIQNIHKSNFKFSIIFFF